MLPTELPKIAGNHNRTSAIANPESRRIWSQWLFIPFLLMLAAAPVFTKVAGSAWLLLLLIGLWVSFRPSHDRSVIAPLQRSARVWVSVCLFALSLQAVATLYWSDPWGDLHVLVRLLLLGAASYSVLRKLRLTSEQTVWLIHALALACWMSLGVTYIYGRLTPSNAIAWAAGVSIFVCVLLPQSLRPGVWIWQRIFWISSVLAGTVGVLLSQSRGSYGLVLWVIAVASIAGFQQLLPSPNRTNNLLTRVDKKGLFAGALLMGLLSVALYSFPRIYTEPMARIHGAWSEVEGLNEARQPLEQTLAINTSVGTRLYMWQEAVKMIANAPVLGYGRLARVQWIQDLGDSVNSDFLRGLNHLHSDPLNILFDHGSFGLVSYLSLGCGLAWLAVRAEAGNQIMRWSFGGVVWMFFTSGLTNMNFAHNYFGVMLSLGIFLAFVLSQFDLDDGRQRQLTAS
jgi:O-antigen ligase